MIIIENLSISYGKTEIIKELNLNIAKNKIHGIMGINGAGKTTFFNALYGIKRIKQGSILLNNKSLSKKEMSYMPAENFFYSNITGFEYLSLFRNTDFLLDKWNELFNLPLNDIIDTYSSGMKKKLAFMSIMKQDKTIIILDEPFNGIDTETYKVFQLIIKRLALNGKTIILSSHIPDSLIDICDYIHTMNKGKIDNTVSKSDLNKFKDSFFNKIREENIDLINKLLK